MGRELRLLVTNNCNFNCYFCHKEGQRNTSIASLNSNDYEFLFKTVQKEYGFNTTTITGGEPLLRKDILEICKKIFFEGGKITIVSNGYNLSENLLIDNYINTAISLFTL